MTKQEYEAALKYAMDTDRPPWRDIAIHQAKNNYIASLEAENAALTLLHTQATDEMLKMQNRVHKLEAEIAQLKAQGEE